MPEILDASARQQALDPARSFIVQAPAGSGKTELLIQRYLTMLARVEAPESVIAITFTRKAAGEMKRRVLEAFERSAGPEPDQPHEALTWRFARAVAENSARLGWDLARNPSRLWIRTVDSLCESIVRRMPWVSRLGAPPAIVENASDLYREAARETTRLVEDSTHGPYIERVLIHLDNDFAAFEDLLVAMLERRDQWLRHIAGADRAAVRPILDRALCNVVEEALAAVRDAAPDTLAADLVPLARHAAAHVGPERPIAACADLQDLPGASVDHVPAWLGIASLLLTDAGVWRRRIDRTIGFPREHRKEKERFAALLEGLDRHNRFRACLIAIRFLPPAALDDRQWELIEALIPVLKVAAAQLRLVFRAHSQCDFTEIATATLEALGSEGDPTDLAIALDCRIQHLLVDEFQDTSVTQFELIERIIAGWEPGDGRTLFLVGDPMQSIYRFREAEVGLFLRATRDGIGDLRPELLRLSTNFRAQHGLVEWTNAAFPAVLAPADDIATAAVRFSPAAAVKPAGSARPVTVHAFFGRADEAEAARVVEIVRETRARAPRARIAVLFRARTHLPSILRELRRAGLTYRAVEVDDLGGVSITQDLLALTRALLDPADRVAWLAILRAPWCGLTLADLYALAHDAPDDAVWDLIHDEPRVAQLSADGQARLARTRAALDAALGHRGTRLRKWIEGCWTMLGGPACAVLPGDLEDVLSFLTLLDKIDAGGAVDLAVLESEAGRLFAAPNPGADESLQVMSIHRAKGLEFDVVIVPGLGRSPQSDPPRLLAWLERPAARGLTDLLLAPIKPAGASEDALYDYVESVEQSRTRNETARLLYVAATRAACELHLLGSVRSASLQPASSSLLTHLWPAVAQYFVPPADEPAAAEPIAVGIPSAPIRRLCAGWSLPESPPAASAGESEPEPTVRENVTFEWAGDTLRHIGTVVHRLLDEIGRDGISAWTVARLEAREPAIETALRTLGVPAADLESAVATVKRAIVATLEDDRGRWIFDSAHQEARSEFPVSGVVDGRVVAVRVDRTFVDSAGVRWIVDFKTGTHEGASREAFLDNERERYRAAMRTYARIFAALDSRPIRMGLYFPLLAGWREYTETATTAPK